MNKDLTLVIMAAGMGSRFGGLKQIEPFGPNDEFIIDDKENVYIPESNFYISNEIIVEFIRGEVV